MKVAVEYEPVCSDGEHASFIAGMVEALLTTHDSVIFVGDPSQIDDVAELVSPRVADRIRWHACATPPRSEYRFWRRLPAECLILRKVTELAVRNGACTVVATSFTRPGLAAAKLVSRFVLTAVGFGVVAHMVLSPLSKSRRDRWLVRFGNPDQFRVLVLGRPVLLAACHAFGVDSGLFRCVTHPYPMADAPRRAAELDDGPLVFGFAGFASERKGFSAFLKIAEQLHGPNARFVVIGRVPGDSPSWKHAERLVADGAVSVLSMDREPVSTMDFRRELQLVDYLVYPYPAAAYVMAQSGAAVDAVWAARPLVASRIPMFEDMFSRIGDIGYLCGSEEDFVSTIGRLIAAPPQIRYSRQSGNLVAGRHLFSADAVGAELRDALANPG